MMPETISAAGRPGRIRWLIVLLLMAIAAVSYLDRSNISIAAPVLRVDLRLSDVQLGTVFSAFVIGYALTQPFAGRLADRFGACPLIAIGIAWWSVLTAATATVQAHWGGALGILLAFRLLLGIGEAIIFPAGNRMVASWIPEKERGLATGLIFAGVGIGAGIAPPLITTLMLSHDWRWAFWVSAMIGIGALFVWLLFARERPERHFAVRAPELAHIRAGIRTRPTVAERPLRWRQIAGNRQVQLLTLSYFCFGYVAYIFFTWFFTYLAQVRGLDLRSSGMYGTLPFIAMAITSPLGGYVSDRLAARRGQRAGRCLPAAAAMALAALLVAFATQVEDARLASMVLALGSGALYFSQSAFWTLSANLGGSSAGSLSGLMNMGCQLGGAAVAQLTPLIAAAIGWPGSFLFTAAICLIGAITWLFVDPDARLAEDAI